jgi:hypothetical protein
MAVVTHRISLILVCAGRNTSAQDDSQVGNRSGFGSRCETPAFIATASDFANFLFAIVAPTNPDRREHRNTMFPPATRDQPPRFPCLAKFCLPGPFAGNPLIEPPGRRKSSVGLRLEHQIQPARGCDAPVAAAQQIGLCWHNAHTGRSTPRCQRRNSRSGGCILSASLGSKDFAAESYREFEIIFLPRCDWQLFDV